MIYLHSYLKKAKFYLNINLNFSITLVAYAGTTTYFDSSSLSFRLNFYFLNFMDQVSIKGYQPKCTGSK